MLEYPPPITVTHFKDPMVQAADDDDEEALVARRSSDSGRATVIANIPCGVLELKVEAPGKKLKESFTANTLHAPIPSVSKKQRLCFAPIAETLRIRWKLRGPSQVQTLKLEIFRRSTVPEAAVWTKTVPMGGLTYLKEGSYNFDGDISQADVVCPFPNDFPDNCLTVEQAPYKLKITLTPVNPSTQNDPPERWVYLDVMVADLELEWGDAQILSNRADVTTTFQWTPKGQPPVTETLSNWVLQQEGILLQTLRTKPPAKNRNVEIPCDAHSFCTDVQQWNDDRLYRSYRDLWKNGPRIPLWAKVRVRNSKGKGVDSPLALGNAKFLWDWEDRGNKINTWCKPAPLPDSRTFLEDSLDYLVVDEFQNLRQPKGSDNCHRNRGGNRGQNGAPVFPAQNPVNYVPLTAALRPNEFPFKVDPEPTRHWAAISKARTRGVLNGKTGALFQPSRIAGDSYRISVYYLYDDTSNNEPFPIDDDADTMRQGIAVPSVSSGWFTMWRKATVRILQKDGAPVVKPKALRQIYQEGGIVLDVLPKVTIDRAEWQIAVDGARAELSADHTSTRLAVAEWRVLPSANQAGKLDDALATGGADQVLQRATQLEARTLLNIWTTFAGGQISAGDTLTAGVKQADVLGIGQEPTHGGTLGVIAAMRTGHNAFAIGETLTVTSTGATFNITAANEVDVLNAGEKTSLLSRRFKTDGFQNAWPNQSQKLIELAGRYYIDAMYPNQRGIFLFQFRSHYEGERPLAPAEGWAKASVSTESRALVFGTSNSKWQGLGINTAYAGRPTTSSPKAHRIRDEVIAHEIGHAFFLPHTSGGPVSDARNALHVQADTVVGNAIDTRDHCLMNYHPHAHRFCAFCILRLRGWSAFGVNDPVNADATLPMVNESFRNRADGTPTITPKQATIVVQKSLAANLIQRTKIEIRISRPFAGNAILSSDSPNIVFSMNSDGTGPLTVEQVNGQTFPAAQINDFLPIYAQATGPGPVVLTLDDGTGNTATADLLGVELSLELYTVRTPTVAPTLIPNPTRQTVGQYIHVQDTEKSHSRVKVVVKAPNPNTFTGNLILGGSRVKLLSTEVPATPETALPNTFPATPNDQTFWAEGTQASAADLEHLTLSIENITGVGDWVSLTVVQLSWKVSTPVTPAKTARPIGTGSNAPDRQEMTSTNASRNFDKNIPLVLLKGIADAATGNPLTEPASIEATVLPAGLPVRWAGRRASDDPGALPTITPDGVNPLKATVATNANGSMHILPYVDYNNNNTYDESKPSAVLNLVLVEATLVADHTNVNLANCNAAHAAGEIRLFSGPHPFDFTNGALRFNADVRFIGGGPDLKRGLKYVFGGWLNNIVSDRTGALYSDGVVAVPIESAAVFLTSKLPPVRLDPTALAPMLDTGRTSAAGGGLMALLSQQLPPLDYRAGVDPHATHAVGGWDVTFQSIDAPGTGFDVTHPLAPTFQITRVWMDVCFRAYLCLWTDNGAMAGMDAPARKLYGVILDVEWEFHGDYDVNPGPVPVARVPVAVTITHTTQHAPLVPASGTTAEVRPPRLEPVAADLNPDGSINRLWG